MYCNVSHMCHHTLTQLLCYLFTVFRSVIVLIIDCVVADDETQTTNSLTFRAAFYNTSMETILARHVNLKVSELMEFDRHCNLKDVPLK